MLKYIVLAFLLLSAFLTGCAGMQNCDKAYNQGYKQAVRDMKKYPELFQSIDPEVLSK